MAYVIVSAASLFVAALTLFSGFGLGTLLLPTFAVFFPIELAVAATAVVHLANNLFKVALVGRKADLGVVLRFALPGFLAAILGAALLTYFVDVPPLLSYSLGTATHEITLVKLVIAILIILFALFDIIPQLSGLAFDRKYLVPGGLLSGFFGGLSGHQGALRSAFLTKVGLDKEAFVGTSTVSSAIVDVARLFVYGAAIFTTGIDTDGQEVWGTVLAATLFAFLGSFLGARLLGKVTLQSVRLIVGVMLLLIGFGLGSGLI